MANLQYDISVVGLRAVDSAFAHVEARARRANRAMMLGAQQAASVTGIRGGAAARVGTAARGARTAAMSQAQIEAEVAKKSAALKEKLAARTAARIAKIETQMAAKTAAEKEALERRAEAARVRHAQRLARIEAASRARMAAATAKEEARAAMRESARAARVKEQEARAELSRLRAMNAAQVASRTRFGSAVGQAAIGGVTSVGKAALGTAAIGGTALIGNAIYTQGQELVKASRLANQVGTPEKKAQLLKASQGFEGFTGGEVLDSLSAWVTKTGDLEAGMEMMREMSQLSLKTGTDLTQMGAAAGAMFNPLTDSIKDPEERLKALTRTLRMFAGAGAIGTIELEDMVSVGGTFASQASRFQGGPEETMKVLNAAAQASARRGGADSAAEAATSLARFGSDIQTKQKDLKQKLGIDIYTDESQTQMKSYRQLVTEVIGKSQGKLGVINELFGERGARVVQGFQPLYAEAERKRKGSGAAAVEAEFQKFIDATITDEQLAKGVASRREDPDIQLKETLKQLNAELGREFLPIAVDLVKALKEATPQIIEIGKAAATFAHWMVDNPFRGLGLIIAAKVVGDIGKAAIAEKISALLAASAAKGAVLPGAPGYTAPMSGTAGAVGGAMATTAGAGALAAVGVLGALYEGYGLKGNLEGGKNQVGANDWSLGSVGNFLTGGSIGALMTVLGSKGSGTTWAQTGREATEDLTHVKIARFMMGNEPVDWAQDKLWGGTGVGDMDRTGYRQKIGGKEGKGPDMSGTGRRTTEGDEPPAVIMAMAEAGKTQADAARMQLEAAKLMDGAASKLNRGNTPSPVK